MREARVIHSTINKACFIISQNKNVYDKRLLRKVILLIVTEVLDDAPSIRRVWLLKADEVY